MYLRVMIRKFKVNYRYSLESKEGITDKVMVFIGSVIGLSIRLN